MQIYQLNKIHKQKQGMKNLQIVNLLKILKDKNLLKLNYLYLHKINTLNGKINYLQKIIIKYYFYQNHIYFKEQDFVEQLVVQKSYIKIIHLFLVIKLAIENAQLWYLAFTLLAATQIFHRVGHKIGDIRPLNIFISEDGSVKIACIYSWPQQKYNYQKSFEKEITYLSPEEVIQLGYGKTQPSTDFEISETFSIGLTLLDAALLSDSSDLYKNSKQIDYDKLQKRLVQLTQKSYSETLVHLIHNMCEVNPQNRTKVIDLYQWLKPYQQSINNFNPFQVERLPQKFTNSSSLLPSQSQYSNIYNPKPYPSPHNLLPTYIQSNPPQLNGNSSIYNTVLPQKTHELKTSHPVKSYNQASIPQIQPYTAQPFLPSGILQSSYVPYKNQQLQQSRKMFPS